MFSRLKVVSSRLGNVTKNTLAVVGLGFTAYTLSELYEYQQLDLLDSSTSNSNSNSNSNGKKKKVLLIPFDKLQIVEQKKPPPLLSFLKKSTTSPSSSSDDQIQSMEVSKLVQTIHKAGQDPEICALYGTFGNGFRFSCGGYAHLEEIRDAIQVFHESHRRHYEPKHISTGGNAAAAATTTTTAAVNCEQKNKNGKDHEQPLPQPKYSYAYADTFDRPDDPLNQEYYLASAFTNIFLQPRGSVHLLGAATSNVFLKKALDKYGVKVHVFKHGAYKSESL